MLEDLPMPRMSQFGVRSPGHEGAGVVVKVGSNVKTWKVGDRGGVKPMWDVCMECDLCRDGLHETYCPKAVSAGLMVPGALHSRLSHCSSKEGADSALICKLGTYQQYIVSPAKYTTRIPDSVDDFTAGPIMCSGSTIYRSVSGVIVQTHRLH